MTMKKALIGIAMAAALMNTSSSDGIPPSSFKRSPRAKSVLTKKQKKARSASKNAKKARKNNR